MADHERFAVALLALAKVREFPGEPWSEKARPIALAKVPGFSGEPSEPSEAMQDFARALSHEICAQPPALMMKLVDDPSTKLSAFMIEVGDHFPVTADEGSPVYGSFRLNLEGDESEIRERVIKFLLAQRAKQGTKRHNKGGASSSKTRLKQLGALRLRDTRWHLTQKSAALKLGAYADRSNTGRRAIPPFATSMTSSPSMTRSGPSTTRMDSVAQLVGKIEGENEGASGGWVGAIR